MPTTERNISERIDDFDQIKVSRSDEIETGSSSAKASRSRTRAIVGMKSLISAQINVMMILSFLLFWICAATMTIITTDNSSRNFYHVSSFTLLSTSTTHHQSSRSRSRHSKRNNVDAYVPIFATKGALNEEMNSDDDEDQNDKRVPVTIRYSAQSGYKPYYLTVAKRVKELYPDVIIQPIEVQSYDVGGSGGGNGSNNGSNRDDTNDKQKNSNNSNNANGSSRTSTFEVIVDGKIVVRKTGRENNLGSVFVSMNELDLAVTRARKRRRPSTAYGDRSSMMTMQSSTATVYSEQGGVGTVVDKSFVQDQLVKSRLEALKHRSIELKRMKATTTSGTASNTATTNPSSSASSNSNSTPDAAAAAAASNSNLED